MTHYLLVLSKKGSISSLSNWPFKIKAVSRPDANLSYSSDFLYRPSTCYIGTMFIPKDYFLAAMEYRTRVEGL